MVGEMVEVQTAFVDKAAITALWLVGSTQRTILQVSEDDAVRVAEYSLAAEVIPLMDIIHCLSGTCWQGSSEEAWCFRCSSVASFLMLGLILSLVHALP